VALGLLAVAAPAWARHGTAEFDPRRPTPGLRLTLVERPAEPGSPGPATYRLTVAGAPRGVLFTIWTKAFGEPFQRIASGFRLTEAGALEAVDDAGRPRRLEDVVLEPGAYPRGAAWEVALVSADYALVAVARTTPRPITSTSGPCAVSLELASRRGERFLVTTRGFVPGETVSVRLDEAGHTTTRQLSILPEGRLPFDVITHHEGPGAERRARYTVTGSSCTVAVDYTWGEPVPATLPASARSDPRR
jgi:hypothetical protein